MLPSRVAEGAGLLVEGGRVARVLEGEEQDGARDARALDLEGLTVYPGFVDVHIHGAVGVDTLEATGEDLHAVARFLASRGVTGWLPTLVPAPPEDYRRAVEVIAGLMRAQGELPAAARAVGVHYEGPFVNTQQCGALRTAYFRTFKDASDLDDLPAPDSDGAARMMTVAPEVEGGVELIGELTRRGWVVSIGHTRADVETLERAREDAVPGEAMTAQDNKRPAAIRVVIPFVFRHWLEQPARAATVAGGLLGATAADLFMPLFSGQT